MNFYDPDGHLLDYRRVEELAGARAHLAAHRLLLQSGRGRSGGGSHRGRHARGNGRGHRDEPARSFIQLMQTRGGKAAGAIRVSFGLVSNIEDASRFLSFAEELRDQTRLTLGDVSFDIESCRVIRDGS